MEKIRNVPLRETEVGLLEASSRRYPYPKSILLPDYRRVSPINSEAYKAEMAQVADERIAVVERMGLSCLSTAMLRGSMKPYENFYGTVLEVSAQSFDERGYSLNLTATSFDDETARSSKKSARTVLDAGFLQARGDQVLKLGKRAQEYDQRVEESGLADTFKIGDLFEEQRRIYEFAYMGPILLERDGVSIDLLMRAESIVNPVPVYKFVTEIFAANRKQQFHYNLIESRWEEFVTKYPNMAAMNIAYARNILYETIKLDPEAWEKVIPYVAADKKDQALKGNRLVINIRSARERINQILFDPTVAEFPEVKEITNAYFEIGGAAESVALFTARLISTPDQTKTGYRKAVDFVNKGIEVEFYSKLAEALLKITAEGENVKLHTQSDLLSIFSADQLQPLPESPKISELAGLVDGITSKRSIKNTAFEIEPNILVQAGLISPNKAVLGFDPNRPRIFHIELTYVDEAGDVDKFNFNFDTSNNAKKPFDWDALETPDQLHIIRDHIFKMAQIALRREKEKAELLYAQRKTTSRPEVIPGTTIKSNGNKEHYEREAKARMEKPNARRQGLSVIEAELTKGIDESVIKGPKTKVILPEDIESFFKGSWSVDERRRIVQGVNRRNKAGIYDIVPLSNRWGPNGEELFRIRIGSFRIIVTPIKGDNGDQEYRALEPRKKAGDKTYSHTTFK